MSAALIVGHSLKPEVRLAQAVSQFEAELSDEHKPSFRSLRSKTIGSPPSIQDVMQLTAEIDRASEKRRRCLGPRLTNVLQATQQFAALGDVLVGGSQNILACGVWTAVRLSLKLIVDFTSYLEKLSNVFMIAGRLAPRHEKMALLYPRSSDLQSSLCEYFIVVVRLCHEITAFARKSTFGKLAASLSDPDLISYQSDLESWGKMIKGEVTYLMAKRLEDEADLNSRFRAMSTKFHKSGAYQHAVQTKQRVLDLCSQYDHSVSWKQIRKTGNTSLFRESPLYRDWKSLPVGSTLVYTGKLGSGKSVLMANIVDDIYIGNKNAPVAYFFCRHDILESLNARTVVGSLARQLLESLTDFTAASVIFDRDATRASFETFIDLVHRCLDFRQHNCYIIVDGLDELDDHETDKVISFLQRLQSGLGKFRICLSLRDYPKGSPSANVFSCLSGVAMVPMPSNTAEIEEFIQSDLENRIETGRLTIGNPTLILEIQDALSRGSEGMFLWVALQIESLCSMESDEEIRHALTDLPRDLSETFARALKARSENAHQKNIFAMLAVANRPLMVQELREALSVVPGDLDWKPDRLLNNIWSTLASCGSLITIDEEQLTVHLVHSSVRQFLLGKPRKSTEMLVNSDDAHRMMAEVIITYLNYSMFERQVSKQVQSQLQTGSLPYEVIRSTINSSMRVQKLAIRLLRSRKNPNFDIGKVVAETARQSHDHQQIFYFHNYATSCISAHVTRASGLIQDMQTLFARLLGPVSILRREMTDEDYNMILDWALMKGYMPLVMVLSRPRLENPVVGTRVLNRAITDDDDAMIRFLLTSEEGYVLPSRLGLGPSSPEQNSLLFAVRSGSSSTIETLLASGKFNINIKDSSADGRTPLHEAVVRGLDQTIALLRHGADYNIPDDKGYTALHLAAMHGHSDIVKYMIYLGSDPNDTDSQGLTSLHLAALHGNSDVVRVLLDNPSTDVSLLDSEGRSAGDLAVGNTSLGFVAELDPRLIASINRHTSGFKHRFGDVS
ncbi:uncharacterized protein N7511_002582 [Penicillium nucicola]|uniref:uncharacterized protein n=1 Tax=Penicillium nucicola TaxID=1850975 RepID=UPI002544D399|nr:uncharacterized protein N7511_002582 [Penicillium nucicola]KAJ5770531.1 hypothetical protein N7511_002582 [Penicillium nucicola]